MKKSALRIAWLHQLPCTGWWPTRVLVRFIWMRAIALACCYWLAAHALAQSQPQPGVLPPALDTRQIGSEPLSLAAHLSALPDPAGNLSPSSLIQSEVARQFVPVAGRAGLTTQSGALWLRLRLEGRETGRFMLEIAEPYRSGSAAFVQAAPNQIGSGSTGALPAVIPLQPHRNRYLVLPLDLVKGEAQSLYVRLPGATDLAGVPLRLWREAAFHGYERNDYAGQSGFFGLAMALTLFNLLLFLIMRDANHLWYVLLSLTQALTIAANNGLGNGFLWGNWPFWQHSAALVMISAASMALLQYARSMLATAQLRPVLDRWLKAAIGWNGAIGLCLTLLPAADWLAASALLMTALLVLVLVVSGLRQGQRGAWFFLAAWLAGLCAALWAAYRAVLGYGELASGTVAAAGTQFVTGLFATEEMQVGAAIQMLLLAFALVDRFNLMRKEKEAAQKQAFDTRQILVENSRQNERLLEQRVAQRSEELQQSNDALLQANQDLDAAFQVAERARERAELARQDALQSLEQLRATQSQIIQSEKMAALGQLIASVAHEINTPIGAIKCSGENIADTLGRALRNVARVFQRLEAGDLALFLRLIGRAGHTQFTLSSREARIAVRDLTEQLQQLDMPMARYRANVLVQLNAHPNWHDYLPLWQHKDSELLVESANNLAVIINNTNNIHAAVERASKTIFALKAFAQFDPDSQMGPVDVRDGIESVMLIYHNQIKHSVQVERDYEEIEPVPGLADELTQVWHNLIHNALQAMKFKGRLAIAIHKIGNEVRVSVADSGCGIDPALHQRIFEPFFTTKVIGEGSGLGLDIVKKIVARHNGRIVLQSEPEQGATFFVYLPCAAGGALSS